MEGVCAEACATTVTRRPYLPQFANAAIARNRRAARFRSSSLARAARSKCMGNSLASFADRGDDSGQPVVRYFCRNCGSPIKSEVAAAPAMDFIKAGTLDDVSWLAPQLAVWCDSAQPWVQMGTGDGAAPAQSPCVRLIGHVNAWGGEWNSVSPGTRSRSGWHGPIPLGIPSMRSGRRETKFHHRCGGSSSVSPPNKARLIPPPGVSTTQGPGGEERQVVGESRELPLIRTSVVDGIEGALARDAVQCDLPHPQPDPSPRRADRPARRPARSNRRRFLAQCARWSPTSRWTGSDSAG